MNGLKPRTRQFPSPLSPLPNTADFRVPPQDLEAEQSVLGAMMLSEQAVLAVSRIIKAESFYRESHRQLYRGIMILYERKEPVDIITLSNELKRMGEYETVGGVLTLSTLIDRVPTAANAEYYANIVEEKSRQRKLINLCIQATADAYSDFRRPEEITEELLTKLVLEEKFLETPSAMEMGGKVFAEAVDPKQERLIPTGWVGFDNKVGGIRRGILTTVTGESEVGKSTGVQNVVLNVAKGKHKVAYIYIDGQPEDLPKRQICMANNWSLKKWESHDEAVLANDAKARATGDWVGLGIRVAGRSQVGNQWSTLKLWMIREWKRNNTDFFVIDGGERIQNRVGYGESRWDAQEKIVDELEQLAASLNVGLWVVIGQSKTKTDKFHGVDKNEVGTNAWRKFSALRLFVYHDKDEWDVVWVEITKNRNWGGKGKFLFRGTEDTYKWTEIE